MAILMTVSFVTIDTGGFGSLPNLQKTEYLRQLVSIGKGVNLACRAVCVGFRGDSNVPRKAFDWFFLACTAQRGTAAAPSQTNAKFVLEKNRELYRRLS